MLRQMGRHDGGVAPVPQHADLFQHADLIAVIQAGRGLVQQQELGLVGQGLGQHHQLPLPAGDVGVGPVPQVIDAHILHGGPGDLPVLGGGLPEIPGAHHPAQEHHVLHQIGEGRDMVLGHIGEGPGRFPAAPAGDVLPVDADLPAEGRQGAQQGLEQGGLSHAVGPQDAADLMVAHGEAHPLQHRLLRRIAAAQGADAHFQSQPLLLWASTMASTGAHTSPASVPMGKKPMPGR